MHWCLAVTNLTSSRSNSEVPVYVFACTAFSCLQPLPAVSPPSWLPHAPPSGARWSTGGPARGASCGSTLWTSWSASWRPRTCRCPRLPSSCLATSSVMMADDDQWVLLQASGSLQHTDSHSHVFSFAILTCFAWLVEKNRAQYSTQYRGKRKAGRSDEKAPASSIAFQNSFKFIPDMPNEAFAAVCSQAACPKFTQGVMGPPWSCITYNFCIS